MSLVDSNNFTVTTSTLVENNEVSEVSTEKTTNIALQALEFLKEAFLAVIHFISNLFSDREVVVINSAETTESNDDDLSDSELVSVNEKVRNLHVQYARNQDGTVRSIPEVVIIPESDDNYTSDIELETLNEKVRIQNIKFVRNEDGSVRSIPL